MNRGGTSLLVFMLTALSGCATPVMVVNHSSAGLDLRERMKGYATEELEVLRRYHFTSGQLPERRALAAPEGAFDGHFSMVYSPTAVAETVVQAANALSECAAQSCRLVRLVDLEFRYLDLTDVWSMYADVSASALIEVGQSADAPGSKIQGPEIRVVGHKCLVKVLDAGDHTNECFRRSFGAVIADATLKSTVAALLREEQKKASN